MLADTPVILTEDQLRERCAYWQKMLGLGDWDVKFTIARQRDFCHEDAQGECNWVLPKKQAFIRILDPADYYNTRWPQDMETCLVHELVHLHFAPFAAKDDTLEDTAQEQAIHALSVALVNLDRKARAS